MATQIDLNGLKIKELRLKKNLTQVELAQLAGITEQSLNRIERGKHIPRESTYLRLMDVLSENSDKTATRQTFAEQVEAEVSVGHLADEVKRLSAENSELRRMLSESQSQVSSLLTMLAKPKGSANAAASSREILRRVTLRTTRNLSQRRRVLQTK